MVSRKTASLEMQAFTRGQYTRTKALMQTISVWSNLQGPLLTMLAICLSSPLDHPHNNL